MIKAIFLDRDGTINIDTGYLHEKDKIQFLPDCVESLRKLEETGYQLFIITNQSGIGRGLFSVEMYNGFTQYFLHKLAENNVHIKKVYTCPHVEADGCSCRKPKTGLFHQAKKEWDIDWDHSYAIGDRMRDLTICYETETKGILLNNSRYCEKADDIIHVCLNWREIREYILGK